MTHVINIFISHSWQYSGHYDTLKDWIFETPWEDNTVPIQFINQSIPRDNPIHNAPNELTLKAAIFERIQASQVVVIPTGIYSTYSKWIGKEIEGAQEYSKPILAVNPWAQERKSSVVKEVAQELVGWKKQSVINGIWKLK